MTRFNASSDEMAAVGRYLREHDVYTMISNNSIHTNPPLCISDDELAHGFDVIDGALSIADRAVQG
jgi:taurine--2-oxoglutarate transaminase